MSWETQGRQYHQWFGHGTGGVDGAGSPGRDLAEAVGDAAVAALGGARGGALAAALADRGLGWLREALPVWIRASGLGAERFVALVGPELGRGTGAMVLQAAARGLADRATAGRAQAMGQAVSAAVLDLDTGAMRFALRAGRDQAVFASRLDKAVRVSRSGMALSPARIELAAAGDLRCTGGDCGSGGSHGTTATHKVGRRLVCIDCATKLLGANDGSASDRRDTLERFELGR